MNSWQTEAQATLSGLVERYSPSGAEAGAVEWLVARMGALAFGRSYVDQAGNAVGLIGNGERQILLLGHIDTVQGEIPVRNEGDLLFGRGAVDAKGSLATFVHAVVEIGPVPGWQFIVIGAVEEERDSLGARHIVQQYRPEYAVIGEPSGWQRCTLGYKGSAGAHITTRCEQAHNASDKPNACETAFSAWGAIQDWASTYNQDRIRLFEQLHVSLNEFSSGSDGFENWARLTIGARLPLELSPQEWYGVLDHIGDQAVVKPQGHPIPAYRAEKNTPLVRALLSAVREQGGKPGFVLKTGTSDLNIVAPAWECPAIAYGPGDSSLDHSPNEHISLSEYFQAIQVTRSMLRQLTNEPHPSHLRARS